MTEGKAPQSFRDAFAVSFLTSVNLITLLACWGQIAFRRAGESSPLILLAILFFGLGFVGYLVIQQLASTNPVRIRGIVTFLGLLNGLFLVSAVLLLMTLMSPANLPGPMTPIGPPESPR